jgi:hypothetical protein
VVEGREGGRLGLRLGVLLVVRAVGHGGRIAPASSGMLPRWSWVFDDRSVAVGQGQQPTGGLPVRFGPEVRLIEPLAHHDYVRCTELNVLL